MSELLRIYLPEECGEDGYPYAWHRSTAWGPYPASDPRSNPRIKHLIRMEAGHRCERCNHPYPLGIATLHPRGEWTPCDTLCSHEGPYRWREAALGGEWRVDQLIERGFPVGESIMDDGPHGPVQRWEIEAQWRILTTHHLNGDKADCRWWNLAALCQRCHLTIQGRVVMEREFVREHTEWMKPHAAGFYAVKYLGEELTREETMARLDELLDLEFRQKSLLDGSA